MSNSMNLVKSISMSSSGRKSHPASDVTRAFERRQSGHELKPRFRTSPYFTLAFSLLVCLFKAPVGTANAEPAPTFSIVIGEKINRWSTEALLKSPYLKTIKTKTDPAYKRPMEFQAIPLYRLFDELKVEKQNEAGETLLFSCRDGFSAPISKEKILNKDPKRAIAYIAIEPLGSKWPAMKSNSPTSAGPYYLIWENPEFSKIGNEEWPQQLLSFTLKPSVEKLFPNTVPVANLKKGYQLFVQNCFMCHTINGQGASELGPDLNIPYNPTEYMNRDFLRKLIRNPQSLRRWPQSKMSAFDKAILPDEDLDQIIAYLKHMAKHKKTP